MAKRVGGIISLKADGQTYQAKGNFTYHLGVPKRESVVGHDGYHGYKETPQAAYIEGEITDEYGLDVKKLLETKDATVTLDLANGKSMVLREAVFVGDGNGNTEEGNIAVRWEGPQGEEVK